MGKDWDRDKGGRDVWIRWMSEVFTEALRVIKPGGHAFVWALPRTSHWTATALEDAGWEIRDSISHVHGSGFPKSMDISKAIDRKAGVGGTIIGKDIFASEDEDNSFVLEYDITAPSTPEAQRYAGYGTALKPSHEVWWLCRKPLSEPTIAQNVLAHGTGGLNIDATRIGTSEVKPADKPGNSMGYHGNGQGYVRHFGDGTNNPSGRFPSNTLFSHTLLCRQTGVKRVRGNTPVGHKGNSTINDYGKYNHRSEVTHGTEEIVDAWECDPSCPVRILGEQSGVRKSGLLPSHQVHRTQKSTYGTPTERDISGRIWGGDTGTAARYFQQFSPSPDELEVPFIYSSKASRSERNRGCEGLPERTNQERDGRTGQNNSLSRPDGSERKPVVSTNTHPTVKSLSLMKYLCRLVGVPGGVILDPFMGSGSTLVAALQEGFGFIGIEQSLEYVEIARARIAHAMQEAGVAEVQGDGEWICHPSCPVAALDRQSGYSKSKASIRARAGDKAIWNQATEKEDAFRGHNDAGGASRYFAQFAPDSLWSMLEDEGSEL